MLEGDMPLSGQLPDRHVRILVVYHFLLRHHSLTLQRREIHARRARVRHGTFVVRHIQLLRTVVPRLWPHTIAVLPILRLGKGARTLVVQQSLLEIV